MAFRAKSSLPSGIRNQLPCSRRQLCTYRPRSRGTSARFSARTAGRRVLTTSGDNTPRLSSRQVESERTRPSVRWLTKRSLSMKPSIFSSSGFRNLASLRYFVELFLLRLDFEDYGEHWSSPWCRGRQACDCGSVWQSPPLRKACVSR